MKNEMAKKIRNDPQACIIIAHLLGLPIDKNEQS